MSVFDIFHMLRARRDVETQLGLLRAMKTTQERVARLEKDMREVIAAIGDRREAFKPGSVHPVNPGEDIQQAARRIDEASRHAADVIRTERAELKMGEGYKPASINVLVDMFDMLPEGDKFWALADLLEKRQMTYKGIALTSRNLTNVRNALRKAGIPLEQFAKDPS